MKHLSALALCSFILPTFSQSNGMDMSMDTPMSLASGQMLPYLHFTPGDTLWFLGWVPSSPGAMVGACIGIFLLSIMERWLAACVQLAEWHWTERLNIMVVENPGHVAALPASASSSAPSSPTAIPRKSKWLITPFVPEFEITRGILYAAQRFLQVLLMMVVMTFQVGFILSISMGSGVGEALFGRFALHSHEHS